MVMKFIGLDDGPHETKKPRALFLRSDVGKNNWGRW